MNTSHFESMESRRMFSVSAISPSMPAATLRYDVATVDGGYIAPQTDPAPTPGAHLTKPDATQQSVTDQFSDIAMT